MDDDCSYLSDELDACQSKLDLLTAIHDERLSQSATVSLPMPDDLAGRQNPDAATAAVGDWLDECGISSANPISVACDEYPCIVAVHHLDSAAFLAAQCDVHSGGYVMAQVGYSVVTSGDAGVSPVVVQSVAVLERDSDGLGALHLTEERQAEWNRWRERGDKAALMAATSIGASNQ